MLPKYFTSFSNSAFHQILLTLFVLYGFLLTSDAQQRYSYQQEPAQTRLTRRNQNIYQQQPYEQPPPEATHRRSSKPQYQPPVYDANNRKTTYQSGQLNQIPQNGNRQQNVHTDRNQNKCRFWIPADVIDKYPEASKIQVDLQQTLILIESCCEGYKPMKWRGGAICRPVCENCRNGLCSAPGECQCYEGFAKNDNEDCVFTCPLGCLNGRCYLDGTCKCDAGYKLDKTRQYCQPICSAGCGENPRHNCTEPEVCGCAKGYQLTDDGCQPVCQPDCGIGGICREANICECERGYMLKDGVCQADCYQKCENGICYARNRCICNPGYTYHERSTYCVLV